MTDSDVHILETSSIDDSNISSNYEENSLSIDEISPTSQSSSTSSENPTNSILKTRKGSYESHKRRVLFDSVDVFYFDRVQGNTCVPCQGGSTLGMASLHSSFERFPLQVFQRKRRRERHRYLFKKCIDGKIQLSSEQFNFLKRRVETNPSPSEHVTPSSPSSIIHEDGEISSSNESFSSSCSNSSDSFVCPGDSSAEEFEEEPESIRKLEDYYMLNAISLKKRRLLLKKAGVASINDDEKLECEQIRQSRTVCGCTCPNGLCFPSTCQCALNGIPCQVDRVSFPCACMMPINCSNPLGRIKFDQAKAKTHYLHTRMRLELEGKQEMSSSQCRKRSRDEIPDEDDAYQISQRPRTEVDDHDHGSKNDEQFLANFNTTLSGGCRDCQNDRYVNVLMHEWRTSSQNTCEPDYGQGYDEDSLTDDCNTSIPWVSEVVDSGYYSSPDETLIMNPSPEQEHLAPQQLNYAQSLSHESTPIYARNTSISSDYGSTSCCEHESDFENLFEEYQPKNVEVKIVSHSSTCKLDPISCFLPSPNKTNALNSTTLNSTNLIPSSRDFCQLSAPDFLGREQCATAVVGENVTPNVHVHNTNAYQSNAAYSAQNNAIESDFFRNHRRN